MSQRKQYVCLFFVVLVVEVVMGASNNTSLNQTLRLSQRLDIQTTIESWDDYAYKWTGSNKAKYANCKNPPDEVKIKKRHIYDCCYFVENNKLRQNIDEQVWDGVMSNVTSAELLFQAEQDNHGSVMNELQVVKEIKKHKTYTWSLSKGMISKFGGYLTVGIPRNGFGFESYSSSAIKLDSHTNRAKKDTTVFKLDQTFKVPPGKRVVVKWMVTKQTLTKKWHADVFLKGMVGVSWAKGFIFTPRPKICGRYEWAWSVSKMQDGKTWIADGVDLRFRAEGVFEGVHVYGLYLKHFECDVDKPEDCEKGKGMATTIFTPEIKAAILFSFLFLKIYNSILE